MFLLRSLDDNRLTSWRWVFAEVSALKVFAATGTLAFFSSLIFCSLPLPGARVLFALSFAVSALFWQAPEVIIDASRYFTQAKHLELYGAGYFLREWGHAIPQWTDLPLMPFLYGLVFGLFGESRVYIQILNSLMFSLTVSLTVLTGRTLFDDFTGRAGGLLMLAMPYLYSQTPLMLVDVPSMFFLMLSLYTFLRTLREGGAWIIFSAVSISSAILCKFSLWPMLSVVAVLFATDALRPPAGTEGKTVFRRAGAAAFFALFLTGLVFFLKRDVFIEQFVLLMGYQGPGLRRWTESYASTFLYQINPLVTAGALYSVYLAVRRRDLRYAVISWLFLLTVAFGLRRIRYTIPIMPFFALMSAYGLGALRSLETRKTIALTAVSCSVVLAVFAYLPFLNHMSVSSLRDAGGFLDSLDADTVNVYTLPQKSDVNPAVAVALLDLYTKKKLIYEYRPEPPPADVNTSPMRFTWQYGNPDYYRPKDGGKPGASAVISAWPLDAAPDDIKEAGYRTHMVFGTKEKVFRFRTTVTVYYDSEKTPHRRK